MLTDQELRQAVSALGVIEERGDREVLQLLLREANDATPGGEGRNNWTMGQYLEIGRVGRELSHVLGEPSERCESAAADVLGPGRQRLRFMAMVNYAITLIGACRELTGESPFTPYMSEPTTKPSQRSTVRIIGDQEHAA
jgi:hypothetical protein